jgi:4-hydroxybenzoate polyprenyltransferase
MRLIRIENCILVCLMCIIGTALAQRGGISLAGYAATTIPALILAAGNSFNSIRDIAADKIAKSARPLPSGTLTLSEARLVTLVAGLGGIITTAVTEASLLWFSVLMLACALLYSVVLKRVLLVGNIVVALQSGLVIVFGGLIAHRIDGTVLLSAAVVASAILWFELAKAIEDEPSDSAVDVRTIAYRLRKHPNRLMVPPLATYVVLALVTAIWSGRPPFLAVMMLAPAVPLAICSLSPTLKVGPSDLLRRGIYASKALWPLCLIGLALVR